LADFAFAYVAPVFGTFPFLHLLTDFKFLETFFTGQFNDRIVANNSKIKNYYAAAKPVG